MRLFVSYARVDKPYCIQIVDTLEAHDSWFDQRLYAGQNWWQEILRRLDWCEGFIYLLSPDSVASEYCRKEFELAQSLGRPIFPILIHKDLNLPPSLAEVHYVDFSEGITVEAVTGLLNAITIAERRRGAGSPLPVSAIDAEDVKPPTPDSGLVISAAAEAMEKGQFDKAVFLLKQAKANNFVSQFISIDALLQEALAGLERQSYLREAEREYRQIADLVKFTRTRRLGCEAFKAFRQAFPDYDPDNLSVYCSETTNFSISAPLERFAPKEPPAPPVPAFRLPLLEWCPVPEGNVLIEGNGKTYPEPKLFQVPAFEISKYPITNAQYQAFLDDPEGYANPAWWEFSPLAMEVRAENGEPKAPHFTGDERPREMINWFDSMAFCAWLSDKLGARVTLPLVNQWVRAARGDSSWDFPWGERFIRERCNTSESKLKMTSLVNRYPDGASPFGVVDMAGNIWEWCLNPKNDLEDQPEITSSQERAVHGGSFIGPSTRAKISFRYYLNPRLYYSSIGFRVVKLP